VPELANQTTKGRLPAPSNSAPPVYSVSRIVDGDTLTLGSGQRVRLVQIDMPEIYFGGSATDAPPRADEATVPEVARVRLLAEPATDRVDQYGRLLRYVMRVRDGLNVNVRLVAIGAAAPYFYQGRRGRYASRLEVLARRARAKRLGHWAHARTLPTTRTTESKPAAEQAARLSSRALELGDDPVGGRSGAEPRRPCLAAGRAGRDRRDVVERLGRPS
jgi:endonuclease YncB( thermonuclease family)